MRTIGRSPPHPTPIWATRLCQIRVQRPRPPRCPIVLFCTLVFFTAARRCARFPFHPIAGFPTPHSRSTAARYNCLYSSTVSLCAASAAVLLRASLMVWVVSCMVSAFLSGQSGQCGNVVDGAAEHRIRGGCIIAVKNGVRGGRPRAKRGATTASLHVALCALPPPPAARVRPQVRQTCCAQRERVAAPHPPLPSTRADIGPFLGG